MNYKIEKLKKEINQLIKKLPTKEFGEVQAHVLDIGDCENAFIFKQGGKLIIGERIETSIALDDMDEIVQKDFYERIIDAIKLEFEEHL